MKRKTEHTSKAIQPVGGIVGKAHRTGSQPTSRPGNSRVYTGHERNTPGRQGWMAGPGWPDKDSRSSGRRGMQQPDRHAAAW
jgi:hypothetical protein